MKRTMEVMGVLDNVSAAAVALYLYLEVCQRLALGHLLHLQTQTLPLGARDAAGLEHRVHEGTSIAKICIGHAKVQ